MCQAVLVTFLTEVTRLQTFGQIKPDVHYQRDVTSIRYSLLPRHQDPSLPPQTVVFQDQIQTKPPSHAAASQDLMRFPPSHDATYEDERAKVVALAA